MSEQTSDALIAENDASAKNGTSPDEVETGSVPQQLAADAPKPHPDPGKPDNGASAPAASKDDSEKFHGHPMKWYFCLIFILWPFAVFNLVYFILSWIGLRDLETTGRFQMFTLDEGELARAVSYSRTVLIYYGVIVVLAVLAAILLMKYKKQGPVVLSLLFVFIIIAQIYLFVSATRISERFSPASNSVASMIVTVAFSAVMLFCNNKYFDNRSDVFVN